MTTWLRHIFQERLHLHYPDQVPPTRLDVDGPWCVHGHFYHHQWKIGVYDYYPNASQFVTMLRDPLEMMISSYFFQARVGNPSFPTVYGWLEHVLTWSQLYLWLGLPRAGSLLDPYEWMEEHYIAIGVLEELPTSLAHIANRLGVEAPAVPFENATPRAISVQDLTIWRERMRNQFAAEYGIYDRALTHIRSLGNANHCL